MWYVLNFKWAWLTKKCNNWYPGKNNCIRIQIIQVYNKKILFAYKCNYINRLLSWIMTFSPRNANGLNPMQMTYFSGPQIFKSNTWQKYHELCLWLTYMYNVFSAWKGGGGVIVLLFDTDIVLKLFPLFLRLHIIFQWSWIALHVYWIH